MPCRFNKNATGATMCHRFFIKSRTNQLQVQPVPGSKRSHLTAQAGRQRILRIFLFCIFFAPVTNRMPFAGQQGALFSRCNDLPQLSKRRHYTPVSSGFRSILRFHFDTRDVLAVQIFLGTEIVFADGTEC